MEDIRGLIDLSILGGKVVEPMTMDIAKSFDSLTFFDRIPRGIDDENIYCVAGAYDDAFVFRRDGSEVKKVGKALSDLRSTVRSLNDGVVVFGYISKVGHSSEFVLVDAYQRIIQYGRQGNGWLSPTFAPAYFKWVLRGETMLRYCVLRDGLKDVASPKDIYRFTGGGYVIVRSGIGGVYHGDHRSIYYIDGGIDE